MVKAKKRKRQQSCDVAKAINRLEKAASTVIKLYRALEPIVKAFLTNGRKAK
jgi:hypothetical protein